MSQKTSEKIVEYIAKHGQASGRILTGQFSDISARAIRKQLKNLFDKGILQKIGKPPKVYYSLVAVSEQKQFTGDIDTKTYAIINKRYLFISPTGQELSGWNGFVAWCAKTKQDPIKTAHEYVTTLHKYDAFRKGNVIDGMMKMKQTFKTVYLDKLFYLDFYSIERFGKTKLGQMLLYAKQSQNTKLIRSLVEEVRPKILSLIKKYNVDAILFVPPTVKREVQFMKELERHLALSLPSVSVAKVKTPIIIPQKTLSKLEDRVENARRTIVVDETRTYSNILMVDDAVGSGATLNETAKQIRKQEICKGRLIGLAITGSFKGFDVISEV